MSNFEAKRLAPSSWVIPGPTNIGIINNGNKVILIDSGNDKESGRKIRKLIDEKGWKIEGIINTHSNADHIGGNDYLQRITGCRIYATRAERAFIETPIIESSFLWGGFPNRELMNKFFVAAPSTVTEVIDENSSFGEYNISIFDIPGHFFEMIGVLTEDKVAYLGDCIFDIQILDKYKIPFVYNVKAYKETIEKIRKIKADYYVMSHGEVTSDIENIAIYNIQLIEKIENLILELLKVPKTFEKTLKAVCDFMDIKLNCPQYALIGSTIRSFLT
ncbi:MAG: MBL fold metallo-hydrolase [Spirochaetaceae bacterium]|jgi:glyoxylase-like metal-dependent hydrolase (beta-lactamase superfamily II)|nr:MBL fold metallo-hydrolase [Spirochaetaceae bacterium]